MLTDSEIKAIVQSKINASMGYRDELSKQRTQAIEYYNGEKFGNEEEGRSQVVLTPVAETIEWILPSLLKIFSAQDAMVFEPMGAEDEQGAEQETAGVKHVFYKKNRGFLVLYQWFKDALQLKNGVVKVYWDDSTDDTTETYENQPVEQVVVLEQDPELTLIARTIYVQTEQGLQEIEEEQLQLRQIPDEMLRFDVKYKRSVERGLTIEVVPPEEHLISKNARSVFPSDADFNCQRTRKTLSDLRKEGFPQEVLNKIPSANLADYTEEKQARDNTYNEDEEEDNHDPSMREVWIEESYLQIDVDQDGIAEFRQITLGGNELLENAEVDMNPFCALTPIIRQHKFHGTSVADLVMDLQLIQSQILRNIMDNFTAANNQKTAFNENNVELDDLLETVPNQLIRVDGNPSENLLPIPSPPIADHGLQMINYLDQIKEARTGVGPRTQGLDDSILQNNKGDVSVDRLMSAAEQRVELIARIFAETGVKDMFSKIHTLLQKHSTKELSIKIKNDWIPVDPRQWRQRTDMETNVGLGNGDKRQALQSLGAVWNAQKEMLQLGLDGTLVSEKNIYKTWEKILKNSDIAGPELYFTDPESDPGKAAREQKRQQQEAQLEAQQQQTQALLNLQLQIEQMKSETKLNSDSMRFESDQMKALLQQQQKQEQIIASMQQHQEKMALEYEKLVTQFTAKLTELELQHQQDVPGSRV